ncbi:ArsR/SmtB family transcription factor [Ruania halotolerans]|uniref:ArsR/SmtB family transcription factor n=1 Tax=Ruania halotolerans TaxID=2897773 RepID=UPI001E4A20D2|nr:metalloregulator ArsR/SmtB family transcription factor [Ruania halotolerans]UFU05476.1 metalloregulator ArsR/SmtB family transcription factor [Ruania halotolerans]
MYETSGVAEAAQLFKVLGNESRLRLLCLLGEEPNTVGALVTATGMSQPLVSQHLRTLRQSSLVTADRAGKEVKYRVSDRHVSHVVADALAHVREPLATDGPMKTIERNDHDEHHARTG